LTTTDLQAIAPIIILVATATLVMLWIAVSRNRTGTTALSLGGIVLAALTLPVAFNAAPREITALVLVDGYAIFYMGLILFSAFVTSLLSPNYFATRERHTGEYFILLLIATAGACSLVCSSHFASFYLSLEVLTVSVYAMIGYHRDSKPGTEAAIKYLLLAAASTAFMLFGMALIYAELGTMDLPELAGATIADTSSGVLLLGFAMVLVGVGFKLSVVPFHLWTPDVYQGAPAPVTAYLATVSKGAVFAWILRYFAAPSSEVFNTMFNAFALVAIASMFVGNLLALRERNIKRLLAYSSIAHVGYLSLAFVSQGQQGIEAGAIYLAAYIITSLGTFSAVTILSFGRPGQDADQWDDYRGLARTRPEVGAVLVLMLLSLAGIPLTAGFIGKFYLLTAAMGSGSWILIATLVINSGIGLYYYLRLVLHLCAHPAGDAATAAPTKTPLGGAVALGATSGLLLWIGLWPTGLIASVQHYVLGP